MNEDVSIIEQLTKRFESMGSRAVFVHSNVLRGLSVARPEPFSRTAFLQNHFDCIQGIVGSADLWFPAFHYDFTSDPIFDVNQDASQVGHLSEHVRVHVAAWRTAVPVFSAMGTGANPQVCTQSPINAFGPGSIFDRLLETNGALLHYGCDLSPLTYIHYCETLADCPYRYTKRFPGRIIDANGTQSDTCVMFHVRPCEREMSYDWARLQADLVRRNIVHRTCDGGREFLVIPARELTDYWLYRLAKEPLYFLSESTVAWVAPKLEQLGRPFAIEDFELTEVTEHG